MAEWRKKSTAEQLADYLHSELKRGRWQGKMPGIITLSKDLGVARNTLELAMIELEHTGVLVNRGTGRGRVINLKESTTEHRGLRISILLGDDSDRYGALLLELLNTLQNAGYNASFASKTQEEMGHKVDRIAKFVNQDPADAWVIYSATQDVLRWFAESPHPSFAFAGRANRVKIPSIAPDKITPLREAVRRLVKLGHRRIIMLTTEFRRLPNPGLFERAFLDELEAQGIPTGLYNLPDWPESAEGLYSNLESLFRYTPPTALFVDRALFIPPTLQFCTQKGLQIPRDFSLICAESDPSFEWTTPSIAHIYRDSRPIIERITRWAEHVLHGREDYEKGFSEAKFIEGGTVGPAAKST